MNDRVKSTILDDEIMQGLFKAGFITSKVFLHRDVYLWVDAQIKSRSISQYKAIQEAEVKFNISKSTIKIALKTFRVTK